MLAGFITFLVLLTVLALSSSKLSGLLFGIVLAVIVCLFFGWLGAFAILFLGALLWILSNL